MSLKVIGTGFGRTGTDSMRTALNMLGFGPTHHMFEIMEHPQQKERWRALALGAEPDWDLLFEGYNSCIDWPSAYYWRELIEVYPEAKVLLTWRTPESWWSSFEKTIVAGIKSSEDPQSLGRTLIEGEIFDGRMADRAHAIATYEANVAAVLDTVPKDRLLVHKLGDGWVPLCAHLGVPVPEEDYPNRNNTSDFAEKILKPGPS